MPGDIISITEKIDGANASICYDQQTQKLRCFSSKKELDFANSLRGFYSYVQGLDPQIFARYPEYIFFGEWLVSHTVTYEKENYKKWYLFSVYDAASQKWMDQEFVKKFAAENAFCYPHELYYGKFTDWEHCICFSNSPSYGEQQEGIVIKNQTALAEGREPHILKYVNPSFRETQRKNHRKKTEDPNKQKEKAEAEEYIRMIVTEARVMKCYHKLVDEGVIPVKFEIQNMREVAGNLPRAVYEDCVKEEAEILNKAGEHAGKLCSRVTMEIVKKRLLFKMESSGTRITLQLGAFGKGRSGASKPPL